LVLLLGDLLAQAIQTQARIAGEEHHMWQIVTPAFCFACLAAAHEVFATPPTGLVGLLHIFVQQKSIAMRGRVC
jgi:hypothetical protein